MVAFFVLALAQRAFRKIFPPNRGPGGRGRLLPQSLPWHASSYPIRQVCPGFWNEWATGRKWCETLPLDHSLSIITQSDVSKLSFESHFCSFIKDVCLSMSIQKTFPCVLRCCTRLLFGREMSILPLWGAVSCPWRQCSESDWGGWALLAQQRSSCQCQGWRVGEQKQQLWLSSEQKTIFLPDLFSANFQYDLLMEMGW